MNILIGLNVMFTYECSACEGSVLFYILLNWRFIVCMFRVTPPQSSSSYIVKLTPSNFPPFLFLPFCFHSLELSQVFFFEHHIVFRPSFFTHHFILAQLCSSLCMSMTIGNFQKRQRIWSSSHLRSFVFSLNVKKQMKWCHTHYVKKKKKNKGWDVITLDSVFCLSWN